MGFRDVLHCIPSLRQRDITEEPDYGQGGAYVTKIAVEQGLRPYHAALQDAGFVVVELKAAEQLTADDTHAIVVSRMDESFMGLDTGVVAPVITAAGRSPLEVVDEVRRSLGPRE